MRIGQMNDYLIIELSSGLGNQMFQYAFGLALEASLKIPVYFDRSWYSANKKPFSRLGAKKRDYALDCFPNLSIKFSSQQQLDLIFKDVYSFKSRFKRKINSLFHTHLFIPSSRDYIIRQGASDNFDKDLLQKDTLGKPYYKGYWQNVHYFENIQEKVRKEFEFKNIEDSFNLRMVDKIKNAKHSIALHIRLGDYVTLGWQLPSKYYEEAIRHIRTIYSDCLFFVFGPHPDWLDNILKPEEMIIVGNNNFLNQQDWCDMMLMSQCENFIIANSSFSWWSGFLSKADHKLVIAPSPWLKGRDDIVCQDWTKIHY